MNQEKYIRVLEETISKLQEENHELKRKLKSGGRKEKLNTRTKAYMRLDKEAGARENSSYYGNKLKYVL